MKTIRVHTSVTIGGIQEGDPPRLCYHKIATRPDGKRRLFAQSVQVTDTNLLDRLRREVHNGDQVEIWIEQSLGVGVSSTLTDFAPVAKTVPVSVS